jgi:hypothetical protein
VLFSIAWIIGYMLRLPNRIGEWAGVIIGPALLAGTLCSGFGARRQLARCIGILVVSHFAAYLCADLLFSLEALKNRTGMLVWGLVYGTGFGAGIGATLYYCQLEAREQLANMVVAAPPPVASESDEPAGP